MFSNMSNPQLEILYLGLKSLIETKSGHGLHNADGLHPVYIAGAKESHKIENSTQADSQDTSILFKMLAELSSRLKDNGVESRYYIWWKDISTWQQYCQFVVDSYQN